MYSIDFHSTQNFGMGVATKAGLCTTCVLVYLSHTQWDLVYHVGFNFLRFARFDLMTPDNSRLTLKIVLEGW